MPPQRAVFLLEKYMSITPEMIESLERQLDRYRRAVANGEHSGPFSVNSASFLVGPNQLPTPKPTYTREGDEIVITPIEVGQVDGSGCFAQTLRMERFRVRGPDTRVVTFTNPVRVQPDGVFINMSPGKGRNRFSQVPKWRLFDPWLVFSGSKKDQQRLKALGVGFR